MPLKYVVALGSNQNSSLGTPHACILWALDQLTARFGALRTSRLYQSTAYPIGSGPDFVNSVTALDGEIPPKTLLDGLHDIEAQAGRVRDRRWGPRVLDLDLIAVGTQIRPDAATQTYWRELAPDLQQSAAPESLILPHPRMQDRAFVLVPMAELVPNWEHPVTGQTVAQMLAALPWQDRAALRPL